MNINNLIWSSDHRLKGQMKARVHCPILFRFLILSPREISDGSLEPSPEEKGRPFLIFLISVCHVSSRFCNNVFRVPNYKTQQKWEFRIFSGNGMFWRKFNKYFQIWLFFYFFLVSETFHEKTQVPFFFLIQAIAFDLVFQHGRSIERRSMIYQ